MTRPNYLLPRRPRSPHRVSRLAPLMAAAPPLMVAAALAPAHAAGLFSLRLTAHPPLLRADGRSTTIITAEVYDDRGNVVADGTRVRFTTTGGRLDAPVVATQGGVARVTLTAGDQPGEAQVIAVLETPGQSVPTTLAVTFSTTVDPSETGTAWARVDGSAVGYVLDAATIQASGKNGGARLTFYGLTLSADLLQINTKENVVRAVGNVTLTQSGVTRSYRTLKWELLGATGVGEQFDKEGLPHVYAISTPRLEESALGPNAEPVTHETWQMADLSGSSVTVVAKSIALEPNNRIQFRRATFWLDGNKTASFPFHVINLQQGTLFQDQIVGFGPTGLSFDLPFYYDVRPEGVGTLHMRRGAGVGSSSTSVRPVWTLDAVQNYNGPNSAEGTLEVNGITRSDWGARLRHGQRLDPWTTGNLYVDFPNNRALYLNSQVVRSFKTFRLDLSGSGSRAGGVSDPVTGAKGSVGGDLRGQLNAETYSRSLWHSRIFNYTFNAGVSRQGYYGGSTAVSQGVITTRTTGATIDGNSIPFARDTRFRQSFLVGQTWVSTSANGGASAQGLSLRGTSAVDRTLGRLGTATFTYDYTQAPTLSGIGGYYGGVASSGSTAKHRVGLSTYLYSGRQWNFNLNASRGLDLDQSTLLSNLRINLGGPWSGGTSLSQTLISGYTYREWQLSLSRNISGKDYTVSYSTTYKRLFFNFAGASF